MAVEAAVDCADCCSQPFFGTRRKREFSCSLMSAYSVRDKLFECQMLVAGHADWLCPCVLPDINDKSKYIVATGASGATPKNRVSRN